jgi:hypothetical protein
MLPIVTFLLNLPYFSVICLFIYVSLIYWCSSQSFWICNRVGVRFLGSVPGIDAKHDTTVGMFKVLADTGVPRYTHYHFHRQHNADTLTQRRFIYIYIYIYIECHIEFLMSTGNLGARGSVVFKALCYKPEGRGFDSWWGEFLNLPNPSGRTRPWGLLSL